MIKGGIGGANTQTGAVFECKINLTKFIQNPKFLKTR